MGDQPRPRSPLRDVDLYGTRRQQAKIQVLEREITFLQEELKSLEVAQPTSRCCKVLSEFLTTKPDPLISMQNQKPSEHNCCFSGCCQSENVGHPRQLGKTCCCYSRGSSCLNYCGLKGCLCFAHKCCSSKLNCSFNCCNFRSCCSCCL